MPKNVLFRVLNPAFYHHHISAAGFLSHQDGTSEDDILNDVVANSDGSTVLVGSTEGDWNATNAGSRDFAAVKLDEDGTVLWKWQVDYNEGN